MGEMMAGRLTVAECLVAYGQAWFEPDHARRVGALRRCCTEDIVFVDPNLGRLHGLDAVADMIGQFSSSAAPPDETDASSEGRDRGRTGANGVKVDVVTDIDEMHGFFRYSFVWTLPDGSRFGGTDFCEVADDGRMKLITVWPATGDFPLPDRAR